MPFFKNKKEETLQKGKYERNQEHSVGNAQIIWTQRIRTKYRFQPDNAQIYETV